MMVCIFLFPEMKGEMDEVSQMFASMGSFTAAFGMDRLNFGELSGFYAIECGNIMGLGGAGIGIGVAAMMYFLNIVVNISDKAAFLRYVTLFAYCDGARISEEGGMDGTLVGPSACCWEPSVRRHMESIAGRTSTDDSSQQTFSLPGKVCSIFYA